MTIFSYYDVKFNTWYKSAGKNYIDGGNAYYIYSMDDKCDKNWKVNCYTINIVNNNIISYDLNYFDPLITKFYLQEIKNQEEITKIQSIIENQIFV